MKNFLKKLGPGFITGSADNDPSGIGTYSQTGAQFGYQQLWIVLLSLPLMTVIQEMCGRVGVVTGKGLATVIRENYPKPVLYFCVSILCVTNAVNIGADLGAMAETIRLLWKLPFAFWLVLVTAGTLLLEVLVPYERYEKFLRFLGFVFLAYIGTAFLVHVNWAAALKSTFIPHIQWDKEYLLNLTAMLGTTISPYVCFWQTNEEVEDLIDEHKIVDEGKGKPRIDRHDVQSMRWDTVVGMVFSQVITFFIILTAAATLNHHGIHNIETASQAAQALRPLAGPYTFLLFTLGIVGSSLLSIPVLAGSSGYAVAGAFNWKMGLGKKFSEARGFYWTIILSILIGVLINFLPIPPFKMLYYTAVLNGIISPPLLVMVILVSNNRKIMGNYTNPAISQLLGWFLTLLMIISLIALVLNPGS